MSRREQLVAAMFRGLMEAVLAVDDAAGPTHPVKPPAKRRRSRRVAITRPSGAAAPLLAREIIPQAFPTPSFDAEPEPVQEPMPGFEGIPPMTLAAMETAVESLTRGNGIPPGFYDPAEGPSVPLS